MPIGRVVDLWKDNGRNGRTLALETRALSLFVRHVVALIECQEVEREVRARTFVHERHSQDLLRMSVQEQ